MCLQDNCDAQLSTGTCTLQELKDSANRGIHAYQFLVGRRYYEGVGGASKDPEAAVEWFEKAAENGSIAAFMHLSACYKDGDGVTKDASYSKQLSDKYMAFFEKELKARADAGDVAAKSEIESIYHNLFGEIYYQRGVTGTAGYLEKAVEEFELSSKAGNASSTMYLVACHKDGSGVPRNEELAMTLFGKYLERRFPELKVKADQGDLDAKSQAENIYNYELGLVYWGNGDSWSMEGRQKAVKYLEAAASKGHKNSVIVLAGCYKDGFGVAKDIEKSKTLMTTYNELDAKEDDAKNQAISKRCDVFLNLAGKDVSEQTIVSATARWELIDKLIGFDAVPKEGGDEQLDQLKKSIEEDTKSYVEFRGQLIELQRLAQNAAQRGARLTDEGLREKLRIEGKCLELARLISRGIDKVPDISFIRDIYKRTGMLPGEEKSFIVARTHGIYSFEHVSSLLWQSRMGGLVMQRTVSTDDFRQIYAKIQSHNYFKFRGENDGIKSDVDSERLLVAGILMHEVSKILESRKDGRLTVDDKESLKSSLSAYKRILESAATDEPVAATDESQRAARTKEALAFSWNVCLNLVKDE